MFLKSSAFINKRREVKGTIEKIKSFTYSRKNRVNENVITLIRVFLVQKMKLYKP